MLKAKQSKAERNIYQIHIHSHSAVHGWLPWTLNIIKHYKQTTNIVRKPLGEREHKTLSAVKNDSIALKVDFPNLLT